VELSIHTFLNSAQDESEWLSSPSENWEPWWATEPVWTSWQLRNCSLSLQTVGCPSRWTERGVFPLLYQCRAVVTITLWKTFHCTPT